jgi:hypothetical protein
MVNDILVQKRKVLHSISSRVPVQVKQATVKPTFNFNALKTLITELGTLMSGVAPGQTLTQQQLALISDKLNKLKTEVKTLTPAVVAPMTAEDHEVPAFWRKNLDYGERPTSTKQATIRGDCGKPCPFGLTIPNACRSVGDAILRMTPIEELNDEAAKDKYAKSNKIVYAYCKEHKPCKFADKIMDDKFHKVDCDYGDNAQGMKSPDWQGSPLYPQTFQGIGLNGLYGYPLGWYGDNSASRNLFFGLFSYLGSERYTNMIKLCKDTGLVMKTIVKDGNK